VTIDIAMPALHRREREQMLTAAKSNLGEPTDRREERNFPYAQPARRHGNKDQPHLDDADNAPTREKEKHDERRLTRRFNTEF